mgnify:CR=1 FL=1
MKFGHFDDVNKEYVIQNPKTPYPWINYLGTQAFFSLISNTAGGYHFYKDARLRRITRYRYNNVPVDMGGRYFYIKDNDTIWSPGWAPVKTELDSYECRHGMGYTVITGKKNGLSAEVTFFVPQDYNGEIQSVVLKNESNEAKTFKLFSFVEWCLWNAQDDSTNFQRNFNTGEVEIVDSTIFHKTEYKERRNHFAFYTVNDTIDGYDTDRESFLGLYNGFENPQVVAAGKASNSVADGWSPIASHYKEITLQPGESKQLVFILGYVENPVEEKFNADGSMNKSRAYAMMEQYNTPEKVAAGLAALKEMWNNLLSKYTVKTPDDKMNRMVNIWNQYQCMVTFNMSRSASYFESGIGRGMGFRDSNQDLLGFVHQIPDRARERLIDLASTQFEDGGCYHQYQPLTKKGNNEIGGDFSDDPLWMILSVAAYIKESGDYSILDAKVPYDNDENKAKTMMDHLEKSFYHVFENVGPHGLPLAMRADWNDCINLSCFSSEPGESFQTSTSPKYGEDKYSKIAESVMVAALFTYAGPEYVAMCRLKGDDAAADKAQAAVDKMKDNIMKYGWDGEWFVRAYDAQSNKVGSKECEEGQIYIEPQGFCVLAGIGVETGEAKKALDSVKEKLDTKYGIVLLQPPYTKYHVELGEISSYPPGYKENAGIFCHNNPWVSCAETVIGRGNRAFEIYKKTCPAYIEDISEIHCTEPYVYSQMIAGKDAHFFGQAKNSWLTGTAAWTFVNVSQYILGVVPTLNGLSVDPCIPSEMGTSFTMTRKYREGVYNIKVENPNKVEKGVAKIVVDGKEYTGTTVIPYEKGKTSYDVTIVMG